MDDDIQFGELEQTGPERQLRPDQNLHYAVVTYGAPGEEDLPIYVDMDVLREMEWHARTNTTVELGGVLLGAQLQDDAGRPFVVVSDTLRAEHYEATRGSFKFTHETWSEITRQRDRFPDDLQMVGWYHTHPDWGVFLSGMDTFICANFFNKPLDVALVIDPCRSDRAFFQWEDVTAGQLQSTSGFFVTASRFRQWELHYFVAQLESTTTMATDPRFPASAGGLSPSVIQVTESRSSWLLLAVIGMLTIQFMLVMLLAWQVLLSPTARQARHPVPETEVAEQREMLDQIIGRLDVAPEGIVNQMEEQRQQNETLEAANQGLLTKVRALQQAGTVAERKRQTLEKKVARLESTVEELEAERNEQKETIAKLNKDLEKATAAAGPRTWWQQIWHWRWYVGGGLLLLALLVLVGALQWYATGHEQPPEDAEPEQEPAADEPRDE